MSCFDALSSTEGNNDWSYGEVLLLWLVLKLKNAFIEDKILHKSMLLPSPIFVSLRDELRKVQGKRIN